MVTVICAELQTETVTPVPSSRVASSSPADQGTPAKAAPATTGKTQSLDNFIIT